MALGIEHRDQRLRGPLLVARKPRWPEPDLRTDVRLGHAPTSAVWQNVDGARDDLEVLPSLARRHIERVATLAEVLHARRTPHLGELGAGHLERAARAGAGCNPDEHGEREDPHAWFIAHAHAVALTTRIAGVDSPMQARPTRDTSAARSDLDCSELTHV